MKYKQPVIVLIFLLFLVSVLLGGSLLVQRNSDKVPLIAGGGGSSRPVISPTPPEVITPVDPPVEVEQPSVDPDENLNGSGGEFVDPLAPVEDPSAKARELTNQREYKVVSGDTVSTITVREWGNVMLWPDLYVNNQWIYNDPDLILPGELVMIFDKLGHGRSELTAEEKEYLLDAYLQVYKLYQQLGEKRNASKWYTLGLALRVEPRFFEIYADRIDPRDIEMVRTLQKQSGAFR
ncbi:LysM peptidoglycan-binding domain-containing protein [Entomospira culicis]|uniref:LysM domain-containing protein n=1 Tax=Entomospira culicis TaxID=2719989 RepID=A0A968GEA5_9SPIO|nr:hypothetical protein [Entomospira culicis]NIZ18781.1 hypothetical protein [Entomospira culicis]NIZ68996.1 hypothetical protein [Entomospira culicis]WDI37587.1 hypothetical protein PVA46_02025 [Entomospira culicis]WDI39215.1 hypothetical protein PVA47_02030 [Entomospira culicis]